MISSLLVNSTYFAHYSAEITRSKPAAKKTIHIINFRGQPTLEEGYIEEEINKLTENLMLLLQRENPDLFLEELYRSVETLVQLDQRQKIFNVLNEANKEFLNQKLNELLILDSGDIFFDSLVSVWKYYCKKVIIIKNIYLCYDRSSQNDFKFNIIQTMCMDLFKNIVILNPDVSSKVTAQVLTAISNERLGVATERDIIKTILSVLTDLNVYVEVFENQFLSESKGYFQNEGNNISEKGMDVQTYLHLVVNRIEAEKSRTYILKESVKQVLAILYREMVEMHLKEILCQGFQRMMDENSVEDLKLMYQLFNKVSKGVKYIAEHFQKYVDHLCFVVVNNGVDKGMIQELIDLKEKLDRIVRECFQGNKIFGDIIKIVFDKMVNMKNSESALYLAKYLDSKLRSKNISEDKLEAILDKVMVIFRFVQGKDIFEAFYRKDLAKRLIFGRSTNQDIEQSIVVKLKEECGEGFTSKIEGMLTDINLSTTINSNFKGFLVNTQPHLLERCDLSIAVLTSSFWTKSTSNLSVVLPDELLNYQAIFSKYYVSIHTGRKLDWQPYLGHCVVRAAFGNTVKEVLVSLFQTIVLLLFNEHNKLTSAEIQELTKLEPKDLAATLHSLSCGKARILNKQPQEGAVAMSDSFEFNSEFTDKLFRIKINQAQLRETVDELKATEKSVLADRQFQIDAAIVRILKSKRVVGHNELLTELFKILDVPVRPQDLKKRIELLIDREYIKRDFDNAATYTYIA